MTGERKIVGLWPAGQVEPDITGPSDAASLPDPEAHHAITDDSDTSAAAWQPDLDLVEYEAAPVATDPIMRWIVATIMGAALLWIAATLWLLSVNGTQWPSLAQWPTLATNVVPPIMLAAMALLIGRRLSARATARQLALMQRLHAEHMALEDRLSAMQAHWRDADRDLQQRADVMANYGLDTVARLHDAGGQIEQVMQNCALAATSLAERGELAQRQLDSLSIAIPRVEEVTARLSDNLRTAGQSAYQFGGQLEARIASINVEAATAGAALTEAGGALSEQVAALHTASEAARSTLAAGIDQLDTAAQQHRDRALILLAEYAASANETTSQSAIEISEARSRLHSQLDDDVTSLGTMLGRVEREAGTMHQALDAAALRSSGLSEELGASVAATQAQLAALADDHSTRFTALQSALTLLTEGMTAFRTQAVAGDEQAVALIQRAETLLIALDSAAREIDETVPAALARLSSHADAAAVSVAALSPLTAAEVERVAQIEVRLQASAAALQVQQEQIGALSTVSDEAVGARQADLAAVEAALVSLQMRIAALADGDAALLTERLAAVEAEATASIARTEAAVDRLVDTASARAATDLSAAIERVAGAGVNERLEAMSTLADQAVAAAASASDRLMRQLITIADSSAALEQRAQEVSALSADVERETLARQMGLLSEALQSTAVDLTRVLDIDVADQAWESYLKGDRSIFARRAARLLTNAEAKDVLRRYEADDAFRGQVNRYIHDFEAMLRGVMDTRDGHSLSVTLLSSDIGKLYVALAQAIERLRR